MNSDTLTPVSRSTSERFSFLLPFIKQQFLLPIVAAISVCVLSGCASSRMSSSYSGPLELPPEKRMSYEKQPIQITSSELAESYNDYEIINMRFKPHVNVLKKDHEVKITYYRLKSAEAKPLVLCLPIMDGKNKVAKLFAAYYAKRGYHAAIVHKQKDMYKELTPDNYQTMINLGLEQIIFNHMQALDWFEQQPEIDKDKIAVSGVSMGSIKGLLVSAYDKRIKATFAALTGGNLPYILRHSDDGGVTRTRNAILEKTGLTADALEKDLQARITHDPLLLAPYIDANQVMMILASEDKTVPYQKGIELRDALGKPNTVYLFGTHISSAMYIFYIQELADHFFKKKLDIPNRAERKPNKAKHLASGRVMNLSAHKTYSTAFNEVLRSID